MSKPLKYRLFVKEGDKHYLIAHLWQGTDGSLMMKLEPSKASDGKGGMIGHIPITSDRFEIKFSEINTPAEVDHTSLHASGQSHTKLKDGSYAINYSKGMADIPLRNLKTVKHLGTLIAREAKSEDEQSPTRKTDVIIERNQGQSTTILDLMAVPQGINLQFSMNWDMENQRMVQLTVGMFGLSFKDLTVMIFARHSDGFDKQPPKTVHLPDMNNLVPFVVSLDDKKAVIQISQLTFDEVLTPKGSNDPYKDFTVITATPKWL
jgi:hypothetical protein